MGILCQNVCPHINICNVMGVEWEFLREVGRGFWRFPERSSTVVLTQTVTGNTRVEVKDISPPPPHPPPSAVISCSLLWPPPHPHPPSLILSVRWGHFQQRNDRCVKVREQSTQINTDEWASLSTTAPTIVSSQQLTRPAVASSDLSLSSYRLYNLYAVLFITQTAAHHSYKHN